MSITGTEDQQNNDMSIYDGLAEFMIDQLMFHKPKHALELGTGLGKGTNLLRRYSDHVTTIDEKQKYIDKTRDRLGDEQITYVLGYSCNELKDEYDFVLVDGPQGKHRRKHFPSFLDKIKDGAPMIFDDAHRDDIKSLLKNLHDTYGYEYKIYQDKTSPLARYAIMWKTNGAVLCSYKIDGGGNQSGKKLAKMMGYRFVHLNKEEWPECKAKKQIWYMNDDIYKLDKHKDRFEKVLSHAEDIKVVLNFVLANVYKADWVVKYPVSKVLFLNKIREKEWVDKTADRRQGFIDTAVLCPPIDLDKYKWIKKEPGRKLVIGRHSRISLKYTPAPQYLYEKLDRSDREFRFMLAHPKIKRHFANKDNFKCYEWNEVPVELFLEDTDIWMCIINKKTKEQGPRTLAEAMAAGCVCIVENRDGPTDKIINGVTGYLVNSEEEVPAIIDELQSNPDLYNKISKAAREYAFKNFNPKNWIKELI